MVNIPLIARERFKSSNSYVRQDLMCKEIRQVMAYAIEYAYKIGVKNPIITETVSTKAEDKAIKREHDQHRTMVAFDLRVKDWSGEQIDAMAAELNKVFAKWAYVTKSGARMVAYCHGKGDNIHFHVAVNAVFKKKEYTG